MNEGFAAPNCGTLLNTDHRIIFPFEHQHALYMVHAVNYPRDIIDIIDFKITMWQELVIFVEGTSTGGSYTYSQFILIWITCFAGNWLYLFINSPYLLFGLYLRLTDLVFHSENMSSERVQHLVPPIWSVMVNFKWIASNIRKVQAW